MRRALALIVLIGCAPAADVVVPPVTTALVPSAPVQPRFDYPAARRSDDADVMHGHRVADPYRWLESDSPEMQAWFEAEDKRARREIAKLPAAPALIAALKPLFANPLPRLGFRRGNVTFIRPDRRIVRRPDDGAESVVFDEAQHAEDGVTAGWHLSRDGAHVLVVQSKNGADNRTALVVETATGRVLERLVGLEGSEFVWSQERGGKNGLFYCFTPPGTPHAGRFGQRTVKFHAVGTEQAKDRVVVPPDNDANASSSKNPVAVTKDGTRLVVQTAGDWKSSTFAVVDLTKPDWKPVVIAPPKATVQAAIAVENSIYVLTRSESGTVEVGRIKGTSAVPEAVQLASPELLDLDVVGKYAVLKYAGRRGDPDGEFVHRVFYDAAWKEKHHLVTARGTTDTFFSPGPDAATVIVTREGLGVPAHRVEFDPVSGSEKELAASKIAWPADQFVTEKLHAKSKDGTQIPITVLRRKDTPVDGTAALAVYGYGGFRNSAEQIFYPGWMIWPEEKGRIFAQCHMRGGVEFGSDWHRDGAVRNRQKSLDDFHACLEALHAAKYSTPGRTVIQGWSHGGMMVTAAALERPDLQRVVIAQAPLEDMIRYPLFGRGGISEYGDPENEGDFNALIGFSPYQNVKADVAYPAFFVTAPSKDERVHPMHPRKIVAALQHASTGGEVLLKVLWDAGHHGGAKDDANEVMAEAWAFALSKLDPSAH